MAVRTRRTGTPVPSPVNAPRADIPYVPSAYVSTGDVGEDTWQMVTGQNDAALFEEFIARFPDHPRAMMAKLALRKMQASSAAADGRTSNGALSANKEAILAEPSQVVVPETSKVSLAPRLTKQQVGPASMKPAFIIATVLVGSAGLFLWLNIQPSLPPAEAPQGIWVPPSPVPAARPAAVLRIAAEPRVITARTQETTVTWQASNVDDCTVTGPNGYQQNNTINGSVSGTSEEVGVVKFTLRCTRGGEVYTASESVTVQNAHDPRATRDQICNAWGAGSVLCDAANKAAEPKAGMRRGRECRGGGCTMLTDDLCICEK